MSQSMLQFVLNNIPDEWEYIQHYSTPYMLFTLSEYNREYQKVKALFFGAQICKIERVQNPFQYGRYMLRREMTKSNMEKTIFHAVHIDDLKIALQFNCDYRRYTRKFEKIYENGQHPKFYNSFIDLKTNMIHPMKDISILVLKILTNSPNTQCDYYIEYCIKF